MKKDLPKCLILESQKKKKKKCLILTSLESLNLGMYK